MLYMYSCISMLRNNGPPSGILSGYPEAAADSIATAWESACAANIIEAKVSYKYAIHV